jgi:hypothetical protein
MSNKKVKTAPMEVKSESFTSKFEALEAKNLTLSQERDAFQMVANQAAQKLINIELLASPFLNKRFNFLNALFHLREFVAMVKQIIGLIKEFKDQYMKPPQPVNDATN